MDRVFLDANVLFSAAYRAESGLTRLWRLPKVKLFTSTYAAEEARLNLNEAHQRERLDRLLQDVEQIGAASVAAQPATVRLPEKDWPILEAAIRARATHLLTGDKTHFGRYFGRRIAGVLVMPPGDYLQARHWRG